QTCVVQLVRNSLRYASKKHWGQITRELREIYTAPTVEAAEVRFAEFAETWRATYPAMVSSWEHAWGEFVPFLEFPIELRKIVYTTNAIESLNARVPPSGPTSGSLPERASRDEDPLPRRPSAAAGSVEPDRQDERLETHPE